ncbi:hypothetical protein FA13DRAFT_1722922 [Coprinellus micaceus]|uniref:Uncharacterized protein n=1 Tax=Coprinellus micaceus TaxID=71717 RepID=A0A4Y7RC52_COPMI|nr:hypothetical protein FA13DRAFT_1722922 [Coprinellus micaceus]
MDMDADDEVEEDQPRDQEMSSPGATTPGDFTLHPNPVALIDFDSPLMESFGFEELGGDEDTEANPTKKARFSSEKDVVKASGREVKGGEKGGEVEEAASKPGPVTPEKTALKPPPAPGRVKKEDRTDNTSRQRKIRVRKPLGQPAGLSCHSCRRLKIKWSASRGRCRGEAVAEEGVEGDSAASGMEGFVTEGETEGASALPPSSKRRTKQKASTPPQEEGKDEDQERRNKEGSEDSAEEGWAKGGGGRGGRRLTRGASRRTRLINDRREVSVRQAEIEKKKQEELRQAQLEKKQEDNKGSGKKHKSRTTAELKPGSGKQVSPPGAPSVQLQRSRSVTPAHPKEMVAATVQEELVRLCDHHQALEGTIGQLYREVCVALREAERVQGLDEMLKAAMEEAAKTRQELQKSTAKSLTETDGREQEKLSQRVSEVERHLGSTEPPSEVQEGRGIVAELRRSFGGWGRRDHRKARVTVEETAMKVTEFGERLEGIRSMVGEVSSKTKQEIEESIAERIGEHIDAKGDTGLDTVQDMINDVELSLSSEMSKRLDELNQRVDNIQARICVVQEEAKDFRAEVLSSLDCIFNAITQPPPSPMHDTSPLTPRREGFIRIPARAGTSAVAVGAGASASAPVPAPVGSVSVAPLPEPVRSGGQMGVAGPSTDWPKVQVVTTGLQNMGKDEDEEMEELVLATSYSHLLDDTSLLSTVPDSPANVPPRKRGRQACGGDVSAARDCSPHFLRRRAQGGI